MSFVLSESEWSGSWLKVFHLSDALFKSPSRSFSNYQITYALCNSRLRCCASVVFSRENGVRKANILNFSSCSPFCMLKCPWGRHKLCPMLKLSFPSVNRWISHPVLMTCERACVTEWLSGERSPWRCCIHNKIPYAFIISPCHFISAAQFWSLVIFIDVTIIWPLDVHSEDVWELVLKLIIQIEGYQMH